MWLICFKPIGTENLVPQILCNSEEDAKNWVKNAPYSVVGTYIYMFVPVSKPSGYWERQEPYQCPDWQYPYPLYPYVVQPARKQWQIEIGDWPGSYPQINC